MTTHRRAVGYTRVSTATQAEEGVSLDAQAAKIRAYCALHDLELIAIHSDAGISGATVEKRPALQEALKHCDQGAVLVAYSISRVSRSVVDLLHLTKRLQLAGGDFVSLSESIDTTSPVGRLFYTIMAALSEFEREQIAQRTRLALDHKRQRGERLGKVPYGWRSEGGQLEADPGEQAVLSKIRALAQAGTSLRQIAAALADQGHTARSGKRFSPSTLSWLIKHGIHGITG